MSVIVGKYLVIGKNDREIDKIVAILGCYEVEGDVATLNRYRPSSNGPIIIGGAYSDQKYYESYWAIPKTVFEKKFGPFKTVRSGDQFLKQWVQMKKITVVKKKTTTKQDWGPSRSFEVRLSENVIQSLKKQCAELGVSASRFISACAGYLLDYAKVDKNGNPDGFNEIIPLISAEVKQTPETDPFTDMDLKFCIRKPIATEKTVRDIIIEYLLTDPTPDEFITKKTIAERLSMSPQKLWTPENREEYSKWENMFKNLRSGEMEKIYSPAIYAVMKQYFQKPREKFPKKYEIADMLQTTAIKLFNMKTPDCEKNRREYDRWKKKFNNGNF